MESTTNKSTSSLPLVLVTGGSGFIALECISQLLATSSYRVRTTIRNASRESTIRESLTSAGIKSASDKTLLSFTVADLLDDKGWNEAVAGCTYVLHVASPFPTVPPKHEDDLIIPAREGTLRVLRAAREARVKRVVLTSSFAAIGYGHDVNGKTFTEEDWTIMETPGLGAYPKSKTLAERAAWDFVEEEGNGMELSVVNPVGVYGPVLGNDLSTSVILLRRMLTGDLPGLPRLCLGVVDVRDVADLHLRAMTDPKAAGERFLCIAGQSIWFREIAQTLKDKMGNKARKVPTLGVPDFMVWVLGFWDAQAAMIWPELGKKKVMSNEKATRMLGWTPRSPEDALVATAESLSERGIVNV